MLLEESHRSEGTVCHKVVFVDAVLVCLIESVR